MRERGSFQENRQFREKERKRRRNGRSKREREVVWREFENKRNQRGRKREVHPPPHASASPSRHLRSTSFSCGGKRLGLYVCFHMMLRSSASIDALYSRRSSVRLA